MGFRVDEDDHAVGLFEERPPGQTREGSPMCRTELEPQGLTANSFGRRAHAQSQYRPVFLFER